MQKVAIVRDSGLSSSWWYAWHMRSSFEKNEAPFSSMETDSRVGIGCLVRLMTVFASRILLFCLGTITTGETHSVGVFSGIFSMMS